MKILLDRHIKDCRSKKLIETIQKERKTLEKMITVSEIFATILHGWPYIVIRVPVGKKGKLNAWNDNAEDVLKLMKTIKL